MILPIKKKWFDMIAAGIKKEEYRELNKYYADRIFKIFKNENDVAEIKIRNGYSQRSRTLTCLCSAKIGTGKEEWGAEKDKQYFVLTIHKIIKKMF